MKKEEEEMVENENINKMGDKRKGENSVNEKEKVQLSIHFLVKVQNK